MGFPRPFPAQQAAYVLTNLVAACAIVFANKAVLSILQFKFTVALTCIHTLVTLIASRSLRAVGLIAPKKLSLRAVVALAAAFTGYIVLCNVSLAVNTVGFYQLTKIAIAPTVLLMDAVSRRQVPDAKVAICVMVVCIGIGLATVFDTDIMTNLPGIVVGVVSVVVSAQYGIWIGSMTKQYEVTSLQLLDQYLPYATSMLALCVPIESFLVRRASMSAGGAGTSLWTFPYTTVAINMIAASAFLGVLVTFSTFLVIGSTSPLTYAITGHVKTVAIIVGGAVIFHDRVTNLKSIGITIALAGVVGYTHLQLTRRRAENASPLKA
jgi:solute carrier family 35 protein E3